MPTSAAIYCRISKEDTDEARRGLGVKRQEKDCRALAERKGWPIVEVFIDDDVSAYTPGKRPEYQRLLDAIKSGDVDALLVYDLDRLHRHPWELEEFFRICDDSNLTELASVTGDFDLASNDGRLMARIMGAVAKKASDDSARRIQRKKQELAESGRPSGGGARAFGYASDRMTIVDAEAEVVREMARRLLQGDSMASICRSLNEQQRLTANGAQWRVATMRNMLVRPRLAGLREHHGEIVGDAAWPPILDRGTWQRIVTLLTDANRQQTKPGRKSLLTGLARCSLCGAKLSVAPVLGRLAYRCERRPGRPGCGKISIVAEPLEELIKRSAFIRLDTPALAAATRDRAADVEHAEAASGVAQMEARLGELAEMFAAGEITRPEWLTARKSLQERLERAQRAASRVNRGNALEGLDQPGQLRAAWKGLTPERRRVILAAVIDRIEIAPARRGLNRFDDERADVTWRV